LHGLLMRPLFLRFLPTSNSTHSLYIQPPAHLFPSRVDATTVRLAEAAQGIEVRHSGSSVYADLPTGAPHIAVLTTLLRFVQGLVSSAA
jgi:hypothetical protein